MIVEIRHGFLAHKVYRHVGTKGGRRALNMMTCIKKV